MKVMTNSDEPAIVVDHLSKRYGERLAVNDLCFTVKRGEVFAFLGPNGAGKSTTVEIITTIRTCTAGSVHVLGMNVQREKRRLVNRIGVLPQGFNSFGRITVMESLRYYAHLFGRRDVDAERLLGLTNLADHRDKQFKDLSGGMKQRLGIAIALVNDPDVLFLDEPSTGLDPRARREVWHVLQDLKSQGKTIFLTTHYMEEAELLADTVAIISHGRIIAIGSPQELIERNARDLCLTLKTSDQRAIEIAARLGFSPVLDEDENLAVRVRNSDDVLEILKAMKHSQVAVDVDVRKPNLEQVFLRLTGEALREHGTMESHV